MHDSQLPVARIRSIVLDYFGPDIHSGSVIFDFDAKGGPGVITGTRDEHGEMHEFDSNLPLGEPSAPFNTYFRKIVELHEQLNTSASVAIHWSDGLNINLPVPRAIEASENIRTIRALFETIDNCTDDQPRQDGWNLAAERICGELAIPF